MTHDSGRLTRSDAPPTFAAIGVPVLLLYVYGVVPISLYRTGSGNGVKGQPMASNVAAMIPGLRFDSNASVLAARPMTQEEGPTFQPRSSTRAFVVLVGNVCLNCSSVCMRSCLVISVFEYLNKYFIMAFPYCRCF